MQSFLEKTVEHLYKKYGEGISELCIVLPNRRAGLFLKIHFSDKLKKNFWAPQIYAIEDFIVLLSKIEIADTTTLLFELYETIKTVNPDTLESFHEFSKWGQVLLNDFNEVDRYLVDAQQLFGNLKDIKELESWSLNKEEGLTDFQKQYLDFWKQLGGYYENFTARLLSKNRVYQGLAYRMVAQNVIERVAGFHWKKIIFAGFNALNKAEERIIEKLLNANLAEIIWDTDLYYLDNPHQEAGKFIRKYEESGRFKNIPENNSVIKETELLKGEKKITIIGAAKNVTQAKVAGELIQQLHTKHPDLQNTALVLADENNLFPVLHSLPSHLTDINITMGYPLKNTPVAGFFDLIFSMHENAEKLSKGRGASSFYHSDVMNVLRHPYMSMLSLATKKEDTRKIIKIIQERNIVFISSKTLAALFEESDLSVLYELLQPVFNKWQQPMDAIVCIHSQINLLREAIASDAEGENKVKLELEYLFAFTKIIKRLEVLMQEYQSIQDIITLRGVLNQLVRSATLPFYGEPLKGLQIMGMLETRTLDFENVILLSCNEGILPGAKTANSFIPFELKKYFQLPTYLDKDAIFSYHFYRLLQRASTIYLIYNTESDLFGSGEKSRFITQLLYELPKVNPNVQIREQLLNLPVFAAQADRKISVPKTKEIVEALEKKAEKGFSPSVLNRFINCPLEFYFYTIAGLKPVDEVEETIGADTLGSIIHEVLEKLMTPFLGTKLTVKNITPLFDMVEPLLLEAFHSVNEKAQISQGKNLLILKVAVKFVSNFLKKQQEELEIAEKKGNPVVLKIIEKELEATVQVKDRIVKIKGKADRIDQYGAVTRIIDYKTGEVKSGDLKIREWEAIQTNPKLAKSFQLLMYALMYQRMHPEIADNLVSGIISFKELSAGLKTVKIDTSELLNVQLLQDFEFQLQQIITKLFDASLPFEQTEDRENCSYCSYRSICNR